MFRANGAHSPAGFWGAALAAWLVSSSAFASECSRPTDPGGGDGYDYGAAEVSSFGNAQVLVWYTTTGAHAVSSASSRKDSVPDDVATVAEVTSNALTSYAAMGFRPVISDALSPACGSNGGDGRLDVYLVSMRGADGMTVPESGRCSTTGAKECASYLFAKANFAGVYDTAEIGIRTVLPHEAFHAIQNAYDVELDRFWAEGTAQWAAKALDPSLVDLERNLPAFFQQTSHSLDAPANGVTAAVLYGSAIWPVFLSQRFGDDIVRSILDREAQAGDSALVATDAVLGTMQSSLRVEYPLFAAFNSATGARAGTGGYAHAADYPLVTLTELTSTGAHDITSGLASFYYHAHVDAPIELSIDTDPTRNTALLVPFEGGAPRVDQVAALPTTLAGEGIVVVSGITTSKRDAPFTLSLASPAAAGDSGCAVCGPTPPSHTGVLLLVAYCAVLGARSGLARRRRASPRAEARGC